MTAVEHSFDYKGDTLLEEVEQMIPQILEYHYAMMPKDVARLLMLFTLNEKQRQKNVPKPIPTCDKYQNYAHCKLPEGHDGDHRYDSSEVSAT